MSDSEWQHPSDLQDFLLQNADEESTRGFGLSEPQLDREAYILAFFNQYKSRSEQQPNQTATKYSNTSLFVTFQAFSQNWKHRKPVFSPGILSYMYLAHVIVIMYYSFYVKLFSSDKAFLFFHSLPTSTIQLQEQSFENRTKEPINYFSRYFSWDTWVEIASCTNKQSNMPNPVTAKEVACFVGVHIAMGTLKVCIHFGLISERMF